MRGAAPFRFQGNLNLNALFPLSVAGGQAFVRCTYDRGVLRRALVQSSEQPQDGFTLLADETFELIDLLCRTYLSADEEERRLIRIFAQLSVSDPSDTPRDLFAP